MDSYEDFFDAYIAYMKDYEKKPDDVSALLKMTGYLQQYAESMEQLEKIRDEDLSDADMAYYLKVMTRIEIKLANAGY